MLFTIRSRVPYKQLTNLQSATKWVETLRPKWTFWRFPDFKGEKIMFPHPSPPCNVVPLFELPLENKKHPNFEWRGQGRGVDSYVSEVTLFEYNVSTILSPIVACSSRSGEYWPHTTTTSDQYSTVRPSRSVSKRLILWLKSCKVLIYVLFFM